MKIALILSGGYGARTGQDVPKQYLTIYDTPIIVYTMINIKESNIFDAIYVVCADGWDDFIASYAKQYCIEIYQGNISAGETRFDSMINGLTFLSNKYSGEDIITIFDANRPAIPHDVMKKSIQSLQKSCSTVALAPCYDSVFIASRTSNIINGSADRSKLFMGQTPESLFLEDSIEIVSNKESLIGVTFAEAMLQLGKDVIYIEGSSKSMKLTTADDFAIFKAYFANKKIDVIK